MAILFLHQCWKINSSTSRFVERKKVSCGCFFSFYLWYMRSHTSKNRVQAKLSSINLFGFARSTTRDRTWENNNRSIHILLQTFISLLMLIPDSSNFSSLVDFFTFASWIFYGMTFFSVIVLRFRKPNWKRPYRVGSYWSRDFLTDSNDLTDFVLFKS